MSQLIPQRRSNQGFTLIELLVVVVIIGILASVALPNLIGQTGKARTTEASAALSGINVGQEAYFQENTAYDTIGTLDTSVLPVVAVRSDLKTLYATTSGLASISSTEISKFATDLGINLANTTWQYATKATIPGITVTPNWGAGAEGLATGQNKNLAAYTEKYLSKTLLDSDGSQ